MAKKKLRLTCPEGHPDLTVRCIVDYPARLSADGSAVEPDLSAPELQDSGDTLGTDCGCWCTECDEWYAEAECVAAAQVRS